MRESYFLASATGIGRRTELEHRPYSSRHTIPALVAGGTQISTHDAAIPRQARNLLEGDPSK